MRKINNYTCHGAMMCNQSTYYYVPEKVMNIGVPVHEGAEGNTARRKKMWKSNEANAKEVLCQQQASFHVTEQGTA